MVELKEMKKELETETIKQKKVATTESESEAETEPTMAPEIIESNFQIECDKVFGLTCLYKILSLDKNKATSTEIKKSYYKLSLRYHPDKVTDELLKEDSKVKFQLLGKIYSILSDEEKRKLYDETGIVDGEDGMFRGDAQDWDMYFRDMFKKVTKNDFTKFFETFKGSAEEREDLIKIYEKNEGDIEMIMVEMISDDCVESEPRFKEIINDAIEKGETKKFEKFSNESLKKASKRKAHYEKEAIEAKEIRKEMGIDDSQDSLREMILARRKEASTSFLDNMTAKYSKLEKNSKDKKIAIHKKNIGNKDQKHEESTESSASDNSDSDEPKPKRKSSRVSATKRAPVKRKVKRL